MPQFTLLGDQPNRDVEDPLGFDGVAEDLTHLLVASRHKTPLTIGVVGDWGSGKSSLMRRLDAKLTEVPATRTVWFNAWTAERGEALEGLVKSVLDQLDPRILRRVARNRKLFTGLRISVTVVAGFFRVGGIVDTLWEHARVDPKTRNELRDLLSDAMTSWINSDPRSLGDRMLIVFVDDLDRCSPDTVFQVFEAIKLYLDAPGITFVVGFDETVISEAILEHKRYSKSITGRIYLDKIVQIEVAVPEPTPEQMAGLVHDFTSASGTDQLLDADARALIVDSGDRNPRRLKRFVNTFVLEQRLDQRHSRLAPQVLIKTLLLQTYFRDFTRLYRERPDPIGEFFEYLDVRDAFLDAGSPAEAKPIQSFLRKRGMAIPADITLADIEQRLPDTFPKLALNQHFVSLLEGLHAEPIREDVRSTLEEHDVATLEPVKPAFGPPSPPTAPGEESPRTSSVGEPTALRPQPLRPQPPQPPEDRVEEADIWMPSASSLWTTDASESAPSVMAGLEGLRVVWVSDDVDSGLPLIGEVQRAGADITMLIGKEATPDVFAHAAARADVIVWWIGVEGHLDWMFVELDRLRSRRIFEGPLVFYGAFESPSRKQATGKLGARVVTTPRELLFQLGNAATTTRRSLRRRAAKVESR